MSPGEIHDLDLVDTCAALASGRLTSAELNRYSADRIEALDGRLNAVAEIYPERIEDAGGSVRSGTLTGVPVLLKDAGSGEGFRPLCFGSRIGVGATPSRDSAFVRSLKRAGLNIIGRTTTPEFTIAATTESELYGPTRNPWNLDHSPGGSSGGAAVAVAAGYVKAAHGTDTGGSIRIPAACCGIVGFKPSRGWDRPICVDEQTLFAGLNHEFLLTRTIRDAAFLFEELTASDHLRGGLKFEEQVEFAARASVRPKVAICRDMAGVEIDPAISSAIDQCAKLVEQHGCQIREAWPAFDASGWARADALVWSKSAHWLASDLSRRSGARMSANTLEPVTLQAVDEGRRVTADAWYEALSALARTRYAIEHFFEETDYLISPTVALPAPKLGELSTQLDIGWIEFLERTGAFAPFTAPYNVSGHPAISIPIGLTAYGLPIGLQLVGKLGRDRDLLAFAGLVHTMMGAPYPSAPLPVVEDEGV